MVNSVYRALVIYLYWLFSILLLVIVLLEQAMLLQGYSWDWVPPPFFVHMYLVMGVNKLGEWVLQTGGPRWAWYTGLHALACETSFLHVVLLGYHFVGYI